MALVGCADDMGQASFSGIEGHVRARSAPIAGARVTAKDPGVTKDHHATSDEDGAYRLALRPGSYQVSTEASGLVGDCAQSTAFVRRDRFTTVDISCDTVVD